MARPLPSTHLSAESPVCILSRQDDRFVAAGWRVVDSVHDATVAHPRAAQIKLGVNRNDWGIPGSFTLKPQSD